jgi:hypothetical protein
LKYIDRGKITYKERNKPYFWGELFLGIELRVSYMVTQCTTELGVPPDVQLENLMKHKLSVTDQGGQRGIICKKG